MHGLPPPPESLSSMQQTASATAASSSAASSSAAAEPSHRCSACGGGIQNDLRRALAGSNETLALPPPLSLASVNIT